jgi:hypothetical protein
MENILPEHLQEIIFSSSEPAISLQISRLKNAGKLKKIAPRIYTSNVVEAPELIIRRNLFTILGKLFPESLLSHRSALEFQPTGNGNIFLTYTYTKKINLPGITVRLLKGLGRIEGDNPISGELYVSQFERALLENLSISRQTESESKTVSLSEIEERLEKVIRINGEMDLNRVRDRAKDIAILLNMPKEFEKLNRIISALLTSRPANILSSPLAAARAFGSPYDSSRLHVFEKLFVALKQQEFKNRPELNSTLQSFRNFAFFESYFSNYIEGTEFGVEDARRIIDTNTPMPSRDEDSHDVLGTFHLVSSKEEMCIIPDSPENLLKILKYRHQLLMRARPHKTPGQFKDKDNRAGETYFVEYSLVKGTLIKGFEYYQALNHPFARAAFIMFLISEVHPFLDGNGRIARVMMNAELVNKGHSKIIIPTVYRDDYLLSLRKLTRQQDPTAYINMLQRIHLFSSSIVGDDMSVMQKHLEASNAFKEHEHARLIIPHDIHQ